MPVVRPLIQIMRAGGLLAFGGCGKAGPALKIFRSSKYFVTHSTHSPSNTNHQNHKRTKSPICEEGRSQRYREQDLLQGSILQA